MIPTTSIIKMVADAVAVEASVDGVVFVVVDAAVAFVVEDVAVAEVVVVGASEVDMVEEEEEEATIRITES